jgi:hypothetical protein
VIKTISLKLLRPNPYRELDKYYYDEDVIKELMESMTRNGVWAGLRARQNGEFYEIAFGHHRMKAMENLGVKEAIVDVQKIDDLHMIMEMADENMSDKRPNTKGITNVVGSAKKKLEEILSGIKTWEEVTRMGARDYFKSEQGFKVWQVQSAGSVGKEILERFLGERWASNIKEALALIAKSEEGKLDLRAAQMFDSPTHAAVFAETMEELDIPVKQQRAHAEKAIKDIEKVYGDEEKGRKGEMTSTRIKVSLRGNEDEIRRLEKKETSNLVLSLEQEIFINEMERFIHALSDIPRDWKEKGFAKAKAYATIITNRLEVFNGTVETQRKRIGVSSQSGSIDSEKESGDEGSDSE